MRKCNRMKRNILYILLCALVWSVTSCRDDWYDEHFGPMGTGNGTVFATVDFQPMASGLSLGTRAAGDAIKDITSLYILLYDYDTGDLVKSQEITDYQQTDVDRVDADAENKHSAETKTKRATFSLNNIAFGKYRIYAVANTPGLLETYSENIKTVDGLKGIPLTWNNDSTKVSLNAQMLGYFTSKRINQAEDEPIVINSRGVHLHAWLRRAASKVTVAYDGSALKEGVFVYLKSVRIKDIPSQCYLGKDNKVGAEGYALSAELLNGELIKYYEGEEPTDFGADYAGPRITAGLPKFGSHGEKDQALYFYENIQGEGKDKRQDADGKDGLDAPGMPGDDTYILKDGKPFGTYIEVEAYYISINSEKIGNGPIVYRFMLGQDIYKDYNARRNCHYKLTLKFKNFANDVDWHVEYEEPEPGVVTPEPYFISYLYNHSMTYPIKINTGGRKIEYIRSEITDNRWAPHNANPEIYYAGMDIPNEYEWNGFLSLHKTTQRHIDGKPPYTVNSNKSFYEQTPKRGEREYKDFTIGTHTTTDSEEDDTYRVEKHPTEEYTFNVFIPMYSRAKQLVKETAYTGNNPYVAYQRKAEVKITTKLEGLDQPFENHVTIYQVRRIVNPKGIYRTFQNNKSFHVKLKRLPRENAETFETFPSEGPWKAYIVKESNGEGIKLSEEGGKSVCVNDTIHGKTGSEIDFNIDFSIPANTTANRYAIIRVEYHNYTCQHLIFVRQGNLPDDLIAGEAKWYAENMKTKTERTASPLEEGSLFKYGNWDYPIDALNNKNPREPWTYIEPSDFKLYPEDGFAIAGTNNIVKWQAITTAGQTAEFKAPTSDMRVAEGKDYEALYNDENIEQGYGILYGDDATETADHINDAYGYDYENNSTGRGMRGCFVYNKETGKNLFFPIGASGYGHRKDKEGGILRYSAGQTGEFATTSSSYPNGVKDAPLFYDIYRRPGAVYWYNKEYKTGTIPDGPYVGWDINYFTLDFYPIGNYSTGSSKDACFVRCVQRED